jgi:hypothetical protein
MKQSKHDYESAPGPGDVFSILITFHCVLIGWVLFRAEGIVQASLIFGEIGRSFSPGLFLRDALSLKLLIIFMLALEWFQRRKRHALEIGNLPAWMRWSVYNAACLAVLLLGTFEYQPFIYFQF